MSNSKTTIDSDKILFIGIPGKPNLTLNLDWPPGVNPEAPTADQITKFAPAKFLTDYKLIIVDPSHSGVLFEPNHSLDIRRKELHNFFRRGGLLVSILRKEVYNFIDTHFPFPMGGRGSISITDRGQRSSFFYPLKISNEFTLYYNDEIDDFWGSHNDPIAFHVVITPLAKDLTKTKVVAFEATPLCRTSKTEHDFKGKSLSANQRSIQDIIWETMPGKMVFLPDYVLTKVDLLVDCSIEEFIQMGTAGFAPAPWVDNYRGCPIRC